MGLRHRMLKLLLVLALLVVGQNHAKLSNASKKKLMQYRTMLEAAEKAGLEGNATTTTPGSTSTTYTGMAGQIGLTTSADGPANASTTTSSTGPTTTSGGMNPAAEGSTTTPGLTTTTSAAKVDDNATTAANGTAGALRYFDNNAGESTKVDFPSDAGNDNSDTIPRCMIPEGYPTNTKGPAGEGTALRYLDNNAGDSTKTDQKQLAQLIKSIFGQLSSGNPVKIVVDIKNPEVMIGNDEQEAQLGPRNRV